MNTKALPISLLAILFYLPAQGWSANSKSVPSAKANSVPNGKGDGNITTGGITAVNLEINTKVIRKGPTKKELEELFDKKIAELKELTDQRTLPDAKKKPASPKIFSIRYKKSYDELTIADNSKLWGVLASNMDNLAYSLQEQGKLAEAEPLFRQALAIREKALGHDHLDVATSLNNLANLLQEQSKYAEAEPLFRRALTIIAKALGPDHP